MVEAAERVNADMTNELQLNQPLIRNIFSSIGQQGDRQGPGRPAGPGQSNMAEVAIELAPLAERNDLSAKVVANRWREYTGSIPDAVKLAFDASMPSAGAPFEVELKGKDVKTKRSRRTERRTWRFDGMFDISDSFRSANKKYN